jgi:hypothetical protein
MNNWRTIALVSMSMFLLTRGAFATPPAEAPEQVLKKRAGLFWQTRASANWAAHYQFLTPEEKTAISKRQFVDLSAKRELLRYISVHTGAVAVDGELGWVEVTYEARPKRYPEVRPIRLTFWDHWQQQTDGQWYPVPKKQRQYLPQLPPHLRSSKEEPILAQRVKEFYQAQEQQDLASLYQYLDPRYQEKVPLAEFTKKPSQKAYLSYRLDWVEVVGEKGRAKVVYTYKPTDPSLSKLDPQEEAVIENWLKINGHWYHRVIMPN